MCMLCEYGSGSRGDLANRTHVLRLLALLEHPDALPADAALRLGHEILMLLRPETPLRQCDSVAAPGATITKTH